MAHPPGTVLSDDTSRGVEGPGPVTLRQPTERHGGNAGIDEEEIMDEDSLDGRVALIQTSRTWSALEVVAQALSVASGDGTPHLRGAACGPLPLESGAPRRRLSVAPGHGTIPRRRLSPDLRRVSNPPRWHGHHLRGPRRGGGAGRVVAAGPAGCRRSRGGSRADGERHHDGAGHNVTRGEAQARDAIAPGNGGAVTGDALCLRS